MRKIKKIFTVESRAYFHYKHGTYFRKNRKKQMALWSVNLLSVCGLFLFVGAYLVPFIKSNSYSQELQNNYQVADSQEVVNNDRKLEPISRNNSELETLVKNRLSEFPGEDWSVYIYDLKDDSTVQINAKDSVDAASLYKLFLIEYLEQKLAYDKWTYTWLSDRNIADCVYSMLQASDDPCSEDLAEYLGLGSVDNLNYINGYKDTSFAGYSGKQTTALDVGKLFVNLKKGQMLSDNARRFIFDALYQQNIKRGMPKGCGDCRTANKQGELNNIAYDAGVVTRGKRNYVLVLMSKGGSFKQIAEVTEVIDNYLR